MVSLLSGEVIASHFARLTSWHLRAEAGQLPVMIVLQWPSQSEAALLPAGAPCIRGVIDVDFVPGNLASNFSAPPKIVSPQYLSLLRSARVDLCSLLLKTKNPSVTLISMLSFRFYGANSSVFS